MREETPEREGNTMQRSRYLLLLPLLTVVMAGCSRKPEGAEYFWASTGSRRTYDVKMLIPLAGVVEGTMIEREDGTASIDGSTYHKTVTTFDGIPGAKPEVSYVRLAADGIYSRKSTDPKAPESLEIPLPPEVGRKWTFVQDDLTMEMEISAVEDFDTAEKTYKRCIKVTGSGTKGGDPIKAVSYYAPKTGLVKMSMEGSGFLMDLKLRIE
jgi:hypothetical protein